MKQESRGEEYESTGWDRVRREEIWRAGWSGRRLGRGESGFEGGIGLQASRESADESDHGGMPKATEAKGVHLREGLLGGPVLKGDAIGSDEDAGAVFAEFAMDKDFLRRGFAEEREEFRELCGSRIGEAADGNVHKAQTEGFRAVPFLFAGLRRFAAEVDDGGDAESLELRK